MVAWWLCIACFLGGFVFAAFIMSAVCLYGWRNKDKMARAMLHHLIRSGKVNADS
jgi:hypothetical protein